MDYLFVLLQRFPHFQQRRIISDVLLYPYYHLANLSRFKRPRVKFTPCNQDALATSIFPIYSPSSYPSFSGLRVLSFSYFLIAAISVATILLFSLFLSLDVSFLSRWIIIRDVFAIWMSNEGLWESFHDGISHQWVFRKAIFEKWRRFTGREWPVVAVICWFSVIERIDPYEFPIRIEQGFMSFRFRDHFHVYRNIIEM